MDQTSRDSFLSHEESATTTRLNRLFCCLLGIWSSRHTCVCLSVLELTSEQPCDSKPLVADGGWVRSGGLGMDRKECASSTSRHLPQSCCQGSGLACLSYVVIAHPVSSDSPEPKAQKQVPAGICVSVPPPALLPLNGKAIPEKWGFGMCMAFITDPGRTLIP